MTRTLNPGTLLVADRRSFPPNIHNSMRAPTVPPTSYYGLRTAIVAQDCPAIVKPHSPTTPSRSVHTIAARLLLPATARCCLPLRICVTRPLEHADGCTTA